MPDLLTPAERARRNRYRRVYGITVEKYDEMFEEQGGLCAFCRGPSLSGQRLDVDHNHTTGRVRGLLCRKCNTALGCLRLDRSDKVCDLVLYLGPTA